MIRPEVLTGDPYGPWSCRGTDIWETLLAARDGDVETLRGLLARDPNLYRAEYWYTQPIEFAVREGHLEAVRLLLDAGASPDRVGLNGETLITLARDRGHGEVVQLLESRERVGGEAVVDQPVAAPSPIHTAAAEDDAEGVRSLLDSDPTLIHRTDAGGHTPLYRATAASSRRAVSALLECGADPNWPEGAEAPRGAALYMASRAGDTAMVRELLEHGADPNATIDSGGSATFIAATAALRALLIEHGGRLDPYDLIFLGEDEEALRRVREEPDSAHHGCGGVLAAACTLGKRELVERFLAIGVRVPPVLTECRSYLWSDPELLRVLLDSGMNPDLPDWQHATPLHSLCQRDGRGRVNPHYLECAEILLDAGANHSVRDEEYRSTPLGWAARNGLPEMVDLLLARGAPKQLADDEPWSTPLAWASRRGHDEIASRLG